MNSYSWRDVSDRLEAFADGHYQIQRFAVGEIGDIDKEQVTATYPLMFAVHPNITPVPGALNYAMEIIFVDLAGDFEDKGEHQVQVISDLSRIALDLLAEIKNGTVLFGDDVQVVGNQGLLETGAQEYNNNLCAVRLTFSLEIPFAWNACEIPADYAPQGTGFIPVGGYPSWCDKLALCPIIIQLVADVAGKLDFVTVDGVTITGDGTPGDPLVAVAGGGTVLSVTGLDTDNTDPTNPVVQIAVDGVTITGDGTPGDPLVAAGGGGGVASVSGESVDNTDPLNPVVNAWPLAGTGTDLANGTIEVDPTFIGDLLRQDDGSGNFNKLSFTVSSLDLKRVDVTGNISAATLAPERAQIQYTDSFTNSARFAAGLNIYSDSVTYPVINIINSIRVNFEGVAAPSLNDDNLRAYRNKSFWIYDGRIWICTDDTAGAAVWNEVGAGGSGDVVGPASAVDSNIAVFDTTTGKLIKDGGATIASLEPAITTLPLSKGGTNKNLTAVNGGVIYSDADSMEVTAAGTAGQKLQSNGAAAPTWVDVVDTVVLTGSLVNTAIGSNTTTFVVAGATSTNVTESARTGVIPVTGTAKYLTLILGNTAQPAGQTLTVTLRINGADTAVTFVVPTGALAGSIHTSAALSVAVTQGDKYSIKLAQQSGASSANLSAFSFNIEKPA